MNNYGQVNLVDSGYVHVVCMLVAVLSFAQLSQYANTFAVILS